MQCDQSCQLSRLEREIHDFMLDLLPFFSSYILEELTKGGYHAEN